VCKACTLCVLSACAYSAELDVRSSLRVVRHHQLRGSRPSGNPLRPVRLHACRLAANRRPAQPRCAHVSDGLPIRQNRQLPKARHGAGARPVHCRALKTCLEARTCLENENPCLEKSGSVLQFLQAYSSFK